MAAAATALIIVAAAVIRNQIKVYKGRQQRAADAVEQRAAAERRQVLFQELQPVGITNCELRRFGEVHDGGYLMCANLLAGVQAGYSYGISGYDKWGCDIATTRGVTVHQYDCFDTRQPSCPTGTTVFHAECVGARAATIDGRLFDTIAAQFERNGDASRSVVMKIDVEGAEWESFAAAPDALLQRIDQLAVELHWRQKPRDRWVDATGYLAIVQRLKRVFEVAHIHFNNASCVPGLEPFPTWAFEVLFVNKRLAVVDGSRAPLIPNALDAPNDPALPDCQPTGR
jgi:hypothetical protein